MTRAHRFCLALLFLGLAAVLATPALAQPSFSKAFDPATIGPGSVSTLTFSIANGGGTPATGMAFTDTLPAGVVIATPAGASSSCSGTLAAAAGDDTISLSGGALGGGSSCTVSVNVTSSVAGTHNNVSGALTSSAGSSGTASASLTVATNRPGFSKSFSPSTVPFNGGSRLTFTIDNSQNGDQARNLTFSDTLPNGVVVAGPPNAATTCSGGTVDAVAGSNTVSYTPAFFADGTVPAGGTCTVGVDVVIGSVGELVNVSGNLTSLTATFSTVDSGKATAAVTGAFERLVLTKSFVDDPVNAGDTVDLQFTLRNIDRAGTVTGIAFTDDLDAALSGLAAIALPASPCGSGSSLTGSSVLALAGGSLAPGESCTFVATLQVPAGAAAGKYVNSTDAPTGDSGGNLVTGQPATDSLFISEAPLLTKTFLANPVGPGDTVTMELTLTNVSTTSPATGIGFTDDLTSLSGTSVAALPANGYCGAGSTTTYSSFNGLLTITGASLAAGASCTFTVDLAVPANAPAGAHVNTTSAPTATVDGVGVTGKAASATLVIVGSVDLKKDFTDDPVLPGGTVTLRFTLSYGAEVVGDATAITFTDDLDAVLSGLVATGLPQTGVCGAGSEIAGTSTLSFTGGSLSPGESCSFDVTLAVPSSAVPGSLTNTTSAVMATVDGVASEGLPATTELVIAGLGATKTFIDDPVIPGGSVTLEFRLENQSSVAATGITFTDDLGNMIAGATASGVPLADPCGAGSSLVASGDTLQFTGGNLAAGELCTFAVTVNVPAATADGFYANTTSAILATFDGTQSALDPASDGLEVSSDFLAIAKEFTNDPASPGDLVDLELTVTNLHPTAAAADVAFTDDLDAALAGLVSVSGTVADVCGTGSQVSGTSVLALTGGNLAAGASCTFTVAVQVPASVALGSTAVNTTSTVTGTIGGLAVTGGTASDTLVIDFLELTKSFSGPAEAGDTVTLTFTIANLGGDEVVGLAFTDDLDAALIGLAATSLPTAPCGASSSLTGTSVLVLSGGSLLPGGSCSFAVDVEIPAAAAAGTYTNVTSALRQAGIEVASPATADLTVLEVVDGDGDGVLDDADLCPGTAIPESVPTRSLGTNRYALVDGDGIFDTVMPNGNGPFGVFTIDDTAGCSCEQIIEELGLGKGHRKFGCSLGAMREWVELVSAP